MLEISANTGGIDTRFTYFQAPVKVEDVLGRRFVFPSEFSVSTLHTEIVARFKDGPGKLEVAAGDYEIFNTENTDDSLDAAGGSILLPAMSVSMAILRERSDDESQMCATLGCMSSTAITAPGGGKIW